MFYMSKSSAMTIRIHPEVKSQADKVLQHLGMTTSEAVNIFLRQVVINNGIPFLIKAPAYNDGPHFPRYNEKTEAAIREAADIIAGKVQTKCYSSFSEFLSDMKKCDAEI
jgi:DNA-damage-inducible protein J